MPEISAVPARVVLADALRVASSADFERWAEQVRRTGGCSRPIHLSGSSTTRDAFTGEVLHTYSTADEPGGHLRVACGNRRASRCPACAWTYAGDTFHLIRAGLTGDDRRLIPATVATHPKVFATLTAPSFGPVHNRPDTGRCRCGQAHPADAPELGTPLDPDTYDYASAVLFNNHAGDLWRRFTIYLRRELARRLAVPVSRLRDTLRLSYGKVAEYQRRGAVHFHAVIRLDGPDGPHDPPPAGATLTALRDAITAAARRVELTVPPAGTQPARVLRWGRQLDIRPITRPDRAGDGPLTDAAVASYVAKYATKGAETTGTPDHRIGEIAELDRMELPDHTRRLIRACRDLDALYPERRLWAWAHMLGFRGHFSTKSRHYSTTLGALRQARADYRAAEQRAHLDLPDEASTLVLAHWTYAGSGHSPGESWLAASIARDLRIARETAREQLLALRQQEVCS